MCYDFANMHTRRNIVIPRDVQTDLPQLTWRRRQDATNNDFWHVVATVVTSAQVLHFIYWDILYSRVDFTVHNILYCIQGANNITVIDSLLGITSFRWKKLYSELCWNFNSCLHKPLRGRTIYVRVLYNECTVLYMSTKSVKNRHIISWKLIVIAMKVKIIANYKREKIKI